MNYIFIKTNLIGYKQARLNSNHFFRSHGVAHKDGNDEAVVMLESLHKDYDIVEHYKGGIEAVGGTFEEMDYESALAHAQSIAPTEDDEGNPISFDFPINDRNKLALEIYSGTQVQGNGKVKTKSHDLMQIHAYYTALRDGLIASAKIDTTDGTHTMNSSNYEQIFIDVLTHVKNKKEK